MAAEYESSIEFTEDFGAAFDHLKAAQKLLQKPELRAWLEITDTNYMTDCIPLFSKLMIDLDKSIASFDALGDEVDSAV